MKAHLDIAMVQAHLKWERIADNLQHFTQLIDTIQKPVDLIVLPEMFTTGFTMNAAHVAEGMNGKTMDWLRSQAHNRQSTMVGSIVVEEDGRFYNRLLWVPPSGECQYYDKRHLFTYANEHLTYTAGEQPLIVDLNGWKVMPLICYDLRFPVWSRNTMNYDLLMYVANFPEKRRYAWNQLLIARAIENLSYTIGVNRVGSQPDGITYSGDSQVVNFDGQLLLKVAYQEQVCTLSLSYQALQQFRSRFDFLADKDVFTIS